MSKIVVGIAHAAWAKGRQAGLDRLRKQLEPQGARVEVIASQVREHASTWAMRLWQWAAVEDAKGADAIICLNDDIEVCPDLLAAVDAMLEIETSRMSSLHVTNPAARGLAHAGERWLRTFHLTGPAYVLRKGAPRGLVEWWSRETQTFLRTINEDNAAIYYAFRNREPIWNSIPSLVSHDVGIPSTLGYDDHPQRRSQVPWNDPMFANHDLKTGWKPAGPPAFVETAWMPSHALLTTEIALSLGIDPVTCWFCAKRRAETGSNTTGARACTICIRDFAAGTLTAFAQMREEVFAKAELLERTQKAATEAAIAKATQE